VKKVKLIQVFLSIILGVFCVIMLININLLSFIIPWMQNKTYGKYYQKSYYERACTLAEQKKYIEAVDVLKEGLKLVRNTHLTWDIIEIHENIIVLCLDAKDFDRARRELKKFTSLTSRKDLIIKRDMIEEIHAKVLLFCKKINNFELTQQYTNDIINYHLRVLDKAVKNANTSSIQLYFRANSLFYILWHIEDSEQALKIAKNILKLSNDKNSPYKRLKPHVYNIFINLLLSMDKQSLAIKSLQKQIKSSVKLNVKIESCIKIAKIYQNLEQYSIANITLEKAVALIDKMGTQSDKKAYYYRSVGWRYNRLKEYQKTITCLQKAMACAQGFEDKKVYQFEIIRSHIDAKNYSTAKNEIEKISRDIFQKDVKRCSKNYCLDSIVNLYAKMKAYNSGITNLQKLKTKAENQDDKNLLNEYANKLKDLEK